MGHSMHDTPVDNSSTKKRRQLRRSGWWNSSADRLDQINRVKEILHQKPIDMQPSEPGSRHSQSPGVMSAPLAVAATTASASSGPSRRPTPKLSPIPPIHTTHSDVFSSRVPLAIVTQIPNITQDTASTSRSREPLGEIQSDVSTSVDTSKQHAADSSIHRHVASKPTDSIAPAAEAVPSARQISTSSVIPVQSSMQEKRRLAGPYPHIQSSETVPCDHATVPCDTPPPPSSPFQQQRNLPVQLDPTLKIELDSARAEIADLRQKLAKAEKHVESNTKLRRSLTHLQHVIEDIKSDSTQKKISVQSMLKHFYLNGFSKTLVAFVQEAGMKTGPATSLINHVLLKHAINTRDFTQAIVLVQTVMSTVMEDLRKSQTTLNLIPSFEDLIYVLSKYLLIQMHQRQQHDAAIETLEHVIAPLVKREQRRGGVRAQWFTTDYGLLHQLVHGVNGSSSSSFPSIYTNFDWDVELGKFWGSTSLVGDGAQSHSSASPSGRRLSRQGVHGPSSSPKQHQQQQQQPPPLFAYALTEYFSINHSWFESLPDLDAVETDADRWNRVQDAVGTWLQDTVSNHEKKRSQRPKLSDHNTTSRGDESGDMHVQTDDPQTDASSKHNVGDKDALHQVRAPDSLPQYQRPQTSRRRARQSHPGAPSPAVQERASVASTSVSAGAVQHQILRQELEPLELADSHETGNFALSSVCGPSITHVRVLDVCVLPETGQVIVATAGNEDRLDKGISLWDVRDGSLISHLDNGTVKPIVALLFHPGFPELLLSADMEFDVKLWNWKEGKIVRWWRKHHLRIVYRLLWVPGDDTRAASCSGDQSLKIWNIHAQKALAGSIHANEPITSFFFCGNISDPAQQKVVISLSYSIRIYKLRTLTMVSSIPLNDLKLSKTPVTSLASYPLFESLVLISADNQLRLFDMQTQAFVRTYSSRMIENGTRIGGDFSPGGAFIYAGASDIRHMPSRRPRLTRGQEDLHQASSGVDKQVDSAGLPRDSAAGVNGGIASGVFLWRANSGKLEQAEMRAMDATDGWEHCGILVRPTPVLATKWFVFRDSSRKDQAIERKALVVAGMDKLIRMYL